MTGTSIDAVDAVLIESRGHGLDMTVSVLDGVSRSLESLSVTLRSLSLGEPASASTFARAARQLGEAHAVAIASLLEKHPSPAPCLCAVHGQTVFHEPPLTWQLLNPWPITTAFPGAVVFDLRGSDVEAKGQGAPITPLADWVMFRDPSRDRAVVNLGGFCNVTLLPSGDRPDRIRGFDVCACNHIIDGAARTALGRAFDRDGGAAQRGQPCRERIATLRPRLLTMAQAGRSLGSGDEAWDLVEAACDSLSPEDAMATAVRLVGETIGRVIREHAPHAEVVLAGGGTLNPALVHSISEAVDGVITTEKLGVNVSHREAAAMAILGLLADDGVAITLPAVTHRRESHRIGGVWIRA